MTESEAIKKAIRHFECMKNDAVVVLDSGFGTHTGESDLVYRNRKMYAELAINALEKQIPKKPILKNGESGSFVDYEDGHGEYKVTKWQDWVCPICGWFIGQRYNRSQNHSHDQRKCNYCNECGQKIDWSDEE